MSEIMTKAIALLADKLGGGIDGVVKFQIEDEGSIIADADGVREGDADAAVTLIASAETFEGILSGDVNPTGAFMSGKLKVDGDMGAAMKLASLLG